MTCVDNMKMKELISVLWITSNTECTHYTFLRQGYTEYDVVDCKTATAM